MFATTLQYFKSSDDKKEDTENYLPLKTFQEFNSAASHLLDERHNSVMAHLDNLAFHVLSLQKQAKDMQHIMRKRRAEFALSPRGNKHARTVCWQKMHHTAYDFVCLPLRKRIHDHVRKCIAPDPDTSLVITRDEILDVVVAACKSKEDLWFVELISFNHNNLEFKYDVADQLMHHVFPFMGSTQRQNGPVRNGRKNVIHYCGFIIKSVG